MTTYKIIKACGIFIIPLLLGFSSAAQDTGETVSRKWRFGIALLPGMSYKMSPVNYSKYSRPDPFPNASRDMPIFSFSGGFRLNYKLSERSEIGISALLVDKGYNFPNYICLGFSCGRIPNHILYVDIPLLYRYRIKQGKRFDLLVAGGMAPSIHLYNGNGLNWKSPQGDQKHAIVILEDQYIPVGLSSYIAIKTSVELTNITLEIGPSFNTALMSFTKDRAHLKDTDGSIVEVGEPYYKYIPYYLGLDVSVFINKSE